jgi:hypothetical protein
MYDGPGIHNQAILRIVDVDALPPEPVFVGADVQAGCLAAMEIIWLARGDLVANREQLVHNILVCGTSGCREETVPDELAQTGRAIELQCRLRGRLRSGSTPFDGLRGITYVFSV